MRRLSSMSVLLLGFLLAGCGESPEELAARRAAFEAECQAAEFTSPQCKWLFSFNEGLRKQIERNSSDSAAAMGMAAGAMAAGAGGRR